MPRACYSDISLIILLTSLKRIFVQNISHYPLTSPIASGTNRHITNSTVFDSQYLPENIELIIRDNSFIWSPSLRRIFKNHKVSWSLRRFVKFLPVIFSHRGNESAIAESVRLNARISLMRISVHISHYPPTSPMASAPKYRYLFVHTNK